MLVATTEARIGAAGIRSTLFLERAVRGFAVVRDALASDTLYAAPAPGDPEPVAHLFLLLSGRISIVGAEPRLGPCAHVLADDEIERPRRGVPTFRVDGDRSAIVQLRVDRRDVRAPVGLADGPLELPAACWDRVHELLDAAPRGDSAALVRTLAALSGAGVIAPSLPSTAVVEEPVRFRRLWSEFEPLYATDATTASLKQIAGRLGVSMRQVVRDAKELATTFGFSAGWRSSLLTLRLRFAAVLLSARDATVARVAKLVGYGSPIALGRAFRDAGLPPPSAVQAALRSG